VGRGVTTVAAASVVVAVAFTGYATGSVGVVTGAVDDVLVRSEKPKPKPWERSKQQKPKADPSAGLRTRVVRTNSERSQRAYTSRFEQVLDQRAAAQAARDAALRERLAQPDQPVASSSDETFRQRVNAERRRVVSPTAGDFGSRVGKREKRSKPKKRPFEKRVEGGGK
jgi:hypothetical protein